MKDDVSAVQNDVAAVQSDVAAVQDDVAAVQSDVVTVAENVERNSALITNISVDVTSLTSSDQQQAAQITSLVTRGTWCAYKYRWNTSDSIITYEDLTYSDSNMNITETPLDISTGKNSYKYYFYIQILDKILIFIAFRGLYCSRVWRLAGDLQHGVLSEWRV